ncbi:MAG: BadF/BadG/BcrA/BcrD ATPase family protein [Microgenomates group bacterium]
MEYVIAIDGGGTKTDVICADVDGNIVGTGLAGPTNLTSTSIGAAGFNLIEGIRQATESIPQVLHFKSFVMGLAGLDTVHESQKAVEAFKVALNQFTFEHFQLENDSLIALANGTSAENALVLISGTGSICLAKNSAGQTARVSGMDYLLTDQGSGYAIGRQVLRHAVLSYDQRGQKTILEQLVCEQFEIQSIEEIKSKIYNPLISKSEVADLTKICEQAAELGDTVALQIYEHAVADLALQVLTVIKRLSLESVQVEGVFSGSVNHLARVREPLQLLLRQSAPNLKCIYPETPPVHGALSIALRTAKN